MNGIVQVHGAKIKLDAQPRGRRRMCFYVHGFGLLNREMPWRKTNMKFLRANGKRRKANVKFGKAEIKFGRAEIKFGRAEMKFGKADGKFVRADGKFVRWDAVLKPLKGALIRFAPDYKGYY